MRARVLLSFFLCFCVFSQARASDHPPLSVERTSTSNAPRYLLGLGVGGGRYADDGVTQLTPGLHIRLDNAKLGKGDTLFGMDNRAPFSLDLRAPFHLTVVDRGLEDGVWRESEYKSPSQLLNILQIAYGRDDGPLVFRAGRLTDERLGHGTLLDRYSTNYGFDSRSWGLLMRFQSPVAGGTLLFDDIIRPGLVAGRVATAPWARGQGASRGLAFGVSFVADVNAPVALEMLPEGDVEFDSFRQPTALTRTTVGMLGLDVEAQAVDTHRTRLTFYSDLNLFFPGAGAGWHTGAFLGWKSGDRSLFSLRGEFRLAGKGYMPGYFSKLYEVSRYRVTAARTTAQTLDAFRQTHAVGRIRTGYFASARWDHSAIGSVEIGVEGGSGDFDEALFIRYATPPEQLVRFALQYELPWVESWQRVHLFEQAYLNAEIQASITPWLVVWAGASRRWRQTESADFAPQNDLQGGATFYYAFPR